MGGRLRFTVFALAGTLAVGLLPTATVVAGSPATVCSGSLSPGTYSSIVVPAGQTCDAGVGPVTVLGGVSVGPGATFMLGFEGGPPTGMLGGGVTAVNAAQVQVHDARITDGVNVQGGAGPFGCSAPFAPLCFTDFEDDAINGGATINGYNGFWLGFIRNHVDGTTVISNNNQSQDQIDIGSNVVNGNLICSGNTPMENVGDSPGAPNTATGHDTCHEIS